MAAILLLGLIIEALVYNNRVWTIPSLVLYATVGVWYLGNMVQDGPENFVGRFGSGAATIALLQVVLFLAAYRGLVYYLFRRVRDPQPRASALALIESTATERMLTLLLAVWAVLFVVGVARAEGQVLAVLWPPSSPTKVSMFATNGVGAGIDFLVSAANYIYILVCALFGVFIVLARGWPRILALAFTLLTWPYFFFDRARNIMLAVLLPGVFCYWVATRGRWWQKALVSLVLLVLLNVWFQQVVRYRGEGDYKMASMLDFSSNDQDEEENGYIGIEMLSELCWMDSLTDHGVYPVTWGLDYVAEFSQFVPRTLWPGKPMLGINYAVARGFGANNASQESLNAAGVAATISTGMIGQGVGNFGPFFGVLAAAGLMALWTKVLVHLWLRRGELLRFLLFLVGCGLTFNLGRDITLLVLWPFIFGYLFVWLIERCAPALTGTRRRTPARMSPAPAAARLRPAGWKPVDAPPDFL
ncbi:MAG: hypothetical protein INR62_02205 [Rhodospirillales bacterium]|nr:hypothetical protein [Acetobacter sp.]